MEFSPIRSRLMNFENTPSKHIVNCDINAWMETNLKKNVQQDRPKSLGRHFPRKVYNKKITYQNSNLASLKQRKLQLLDSNRKVPSLNSISKTEKTVAQTERPSGSTFQVNFTHKPLAQEGHEPLQTITDFKLKLNQMEVSQFKGQQQSNVRKTIFKKSNQNIPPLLKKNLHPGKAHKVVIGASSNMNELFEKIKHNQKMQIEKRKNNKMVSINPEMRNLIYKSKKVLSVSNFPMR